MRIVINGFGRIGRTILRQILTQPDHDDIEVALVNDIARCCQTNENSHRITGAT
ncbi:MAG: hypothetical protein HOI22_11520 [Tateyamaria sp.]|nr:hypothetical protein [Tateyamaria sp.]